jgi:hypothetical protein
MIGKQKTCKTGISCGNTCISKTKTCKKATSPQQKAAKAQIERKVKGKTEGRDLEAKRARSAIESKARGQRMKKNYREDGIAKHDRAIDKAALIHGIGSDEHRMAVHGRSAAEALGNYNRAQKTGSPAAITKAEKGIRRTVKNIGKENLNRLSDDQQTDLKSVQSKMRLKSAGQVSSRLDYWGSQQAKEADRKRQIKKDMKARRRETGIPTIADKKRRAKARENMAERARIQRAKKQGG